MNRTAHAIETLDLAQPALAAWLGVAQPTVSRLVTGQPESGPISRMLDHLDLVLARDGVDAARAMVLAGSLEVPGVKDGGAETPAYSPMKHESGFARCE